MDLFILFIVIILSTFVNSSCCWQFFTSLSDIVMTNSDPHVEFTHSEYIYGNCADKSLAFYTHQHLDHMQVLGKVIIRGWLDLYRIPTCIILRATAYHEDSFRSTAYNFQMCVPRITYLHSKQRYKYYYYEWYISPDYIGGMNWDIYFYGPASATW